MKKKRILKTIAILLVAILLLPSNVYAKKKVKLSNTKKTVTVGKTATIKLLNNSKSVKWSTTNGKIKIIKKTKKYAKIKGVKAGNAYLKAKVGGKTYKCKVTVKKPANNTTQKVTTEQTTEEIIVEEITTEQQTTIEEQTTERITTEQTTEEIIVEEMTTEQQTTIEEQTTEKITTELSTTKDNVNIRTINKVLCEDKNVCVTLKEIRNGKIYIAIKNKSQYDFSFGDRYLILNGETYYNDFYVTTVFANTELLDRVDVHNMDYDRVDYQFENGTFSGRFYYYARDKEYNTVEENDMAFEIKIGETIEVITTEQPTTVEEQTTEKITTELSTEEIIVEEMTTEKENNEQFDEKEIDENISVECIKAKDEIIAIYKNDNDFTVSIEPTMFFYDSDGQAISLSDGDGNYCFEGNSTCVMRFDYPVNSYGERVEFAYYGTIHNVEKSKYIGYAKSISVSSNFGSNSVMATVNNNTGMSVETCKLAIIYYDKDGNAIGYNREYADFENGELSDIVSFEFPEDEIPASYEIFVNNAYNFLD